MGIKLQPQGMYSSKPFGCLSWSETTVMKPLPSPGSREIAERDF